MHRQKAYVFPSWMTLISNLSVFQGVYPVQLNPPTSQKLCLLCRTSWCLNSRTDQKCRTHVQRQRECLKLGIAVSMEHWRPQRLIRFTVTIVFFFQFCSVEMLSLQFASYINPYTRWKLNVFFFNPKETSWGLKGPVAYISDHCVSKSSLSKIFLCLRIHIC